jgi:hypothetical protein
MFWVSTDADWAMLKERMKCSRPGRARSGLRNIPEFIGLQPWNVYPAIPRSPTNLTGYTLAAGQGTNSSGRPKHHHCKSASRRVSLHDTAPRRPSTLRTACPGSNARRLVPGSAGPGHLQMHVTCAAREGRGEATWAAWPAGLVGIGHAHIDALLHNRLRRRAGHR